MTDDRRDPLDVRIDEVLAAMTAGEPRRVNAASVRAAIEAAPRRAASGPGPWLALAAALVLAFAVAIRARTERPGPSTATAGAPASGPSPVPAKTLPGSVSESALLTAATRAVTAPAVGRRRAVAHLPRGEEAPAFPRLDVASIDRPEPLTPGALKSEALVVSRMDTAPLLLATLNQDPELHP